MDPHTQDAAHPAPGTPPLAGLPFDQQQRDWAVRATLAALRGQPRLKVLEISAGRGALAALLPDDVVTVALGDVAALLAQRADAALPYPGEAFDVVVVADALDRLPADQRPTLLEQAARVAGEAVVIAGPFDTPLVREAEDALERLAQARLGEELPALADHRRHGLPGLEATEAFWRERGFQTTGFPCGYLPDWLPAQALSLLFRGGYHDPILEERARRYADDAFSPAASRTPSYRQVVVAARGRDLSALRARLGIPPAAEPEDAAARLEELATVIRALAASWSELVEELEERLGAREKVIQGLSTQLSYAQGSLQAIRGSTAWRYVRLWWDLSERLLPARSRRKRLVREAAHLARLARGEGPVAVARATVPYPARRFLRRTIFKKARGPVGLEQIKGFVPADWAAQTAAAAPTYDVVVFPIIDWNFRFQRPQQIARHFARAGHRVLYLATEFRHGDKPLLWELEPNVVAVQLPGPRFTSLYADVIDDRLLSQLVDAFADLRAELDVVQAVCMVDLPFWAPLALRLRERYGWKVVYDCMDDYASFSTVGKRMLRAEATLSRESDLVLASSRGIFAAQAAHNPRCLLVPNAADFEHFHTPPAALPADVRDLPRPIVGYYGAISDWFDAALVADLARARPWWSFVLVGSTYGADLAPLSGLRNVHLLGEKPYAEIAAYAHAFDVGMIPFKRTPLTDATNPVKLFEYLAAGKPVVATELGELTHYREQVRLVADRAQWLDALEAAMRPASPRAVEARVAFARENSWDARATQIAAAVEALYPLASIVIVTYNNLDYTRLCLESIYAKTVYPRFEVIVVDNASQDETPTYLEEFAASHPRCRVILNPTNDGFARANNRGLAAARGEYVVFLNNDTVVTRGWLSRLLYHLRDPRVGMVGPVTNSTGNEARVLVDYTAIGDMEAFARRYTRAHFGETFDIRVLALFCVAMRRSVVDEVGPLDERFGIGMFEDDDYALRVREKGYRIICAEDVFVHHWGSASFSKLQDRVYQALFDENRRKFEAKWGQKWQPHRYRDAVAP
ncbi:MAG TPA: glycosyltransferase [Chloroflexota bacterium]|nr:glycosyltransferase [Chloroflexota bacterium]